MTLTFIRLPRYSVVGKRVLDILGSEKCLGLEIGLSDPGTASWAEVTWPPKPKVFCEGSDPRTTERGRSMVKVGIPETE